MDMLNPYADIDKNKVQIETKTELSGYYKSPKGYIVNKDSEGLAAYKMKRKKQTELNNMKDDIDQLKNDMQEIKELLKGLVK